MICIIDYDMGNVGSIRNILKRICSENVVISRDKQDIIKANKYILPGVGSFDAGINNLKQFDIINLLKDEVLSTSKPLLGICLGMQLLGNRSEEGSQDGLGLIPFDTVKFQVTEDFKIPHMGWDYVSINKPSDPLVRGLSNHERYYFVHSYHAKCQYDNNILMKCSYSYEFAAAVVNKNIYGVQFHPEKSHKFGMKLLQNFVEM